MHVPKFLQKNATSKIIKKYLKKPISPWCSAFLGSRPLPQTDPSKGPFLTVFAMFYAHRALLKKEPLFCLGGGEKIGRRLGLGNANVSGFSAPHSFSKKITQKNFSSPPASFAQYFMCPSHSFSIYTTPNFSRCLIHYFMHMCIPNIIQSLMFLCLCGCFTNHNS